MRKCPACRKAIGLFRLALWTKFRAFACHHCGATVRRNDDDVVRIVLSVAALGLGSLVVIGITTRSWSHLELLEAIVGVAYVAARCFPRFEVEDPSL
jgi:hypothetical protein